MTIESLTGWALSVLLVSLRVGPAFAFAPPFTLTRLPTLFRVLLGMAVAGCLMSAHPDMILPAVPEAGDLLVAAGCELMLGGIVVLVFQLMFGALYVAGRTIDVQAGFGLSLLIDPTSKAQVPLAGTLFALAAAAVFFGMNGHLELLRILAASLDAIPVGAGASLPPLPRLAAFMSAVFMTAFGIAGAAILCLFLTDLAIALISRTAPQLNALVLGFQIKTMLFLLVLPASFGMSGALFARLSRITLEALPRLL